MKKVTVIIDTNKYAGNFEREMCAYLTGQIGDCGFGIEIAEVESNEIEHLQEWSKIIRQEQDEHNCYRPCAIYPSTQGYFNNGAGGIFEEGQEKEAAMHAHEWRKRHFNNPHVQEEPLTKYPAYTAVAIFCSEIPSQDAMKEIKRRAEEFRNVHGQDDMKILSVYVKVTVEVERIIHF